MKKIIVMLYFLHLVNTVSAQNFQSFDLEANTDANPRQMVQIGNKVVFFAYTDALGEELYAFDNSTQSVSLLKDIYPGVQSSTYGYTEYIIFQNKIYFAANDSVHGIELWVSDGTPNGTILLKDIYSGQENSYPGQFFIFNNQLYFTAQTFDEGHELWVTDGTSAGTQLLKDIEPGAGGSYPNSYCICNGWLYFTAFTNANGSELWKTDGNSSNTMLVKDLTNDNQDGMGYSPFGPVCLNNLLIFVGQSTIDDQELWVSDGTASGTQLLKDIRLGTYGSYPSYFTLFNNHLYFTADNGINGQELWKTDGTTSNTSLVKDIFPGSTGSYPFNLFVADSILLFAAESSNNNVELWKTNGNETVMLKNIHPTASSYPENFIAYNGKIFFSAEDATNGKELFVTDGTTSGTMLFKNINTNMLAGSYPISFTIHDNKLFFIADIGPINNENYQLFVSDGTPSGTQMIAPQASNNPFNTFFYPFFLTSTPYGLFFKSSFQPIGQFELWRYYQQTTFIDKNSSVSSFHCYPNPYKNFINCEADTNQEVEFYNLQGKLLFKTNIKQGLQTIHLENYCEPIIIKNSEKSFIMLPEASK